MVNLKRIRIERDDFSHSITPDTRRCFMNSVSQWVHQHDALLLMILVLGVSFALLLAYRRRSVRLWSVWVIAAGLGTSAALAIRTPAASLSEHTVPADDTAPAPTTASTYEEPTVKSVEDIRSLLAKGGKPTLVEIYSDFGIY
jgi:hypothetical protein